MAQELSAQVVKGVQGIGYVCAFLLSLVICVPMSMHQDQFKGRCLLFSTGLWQEEDGQFKVDWASQAYCNFTIFVAVIMFVISLGQFVRFLKFFYKGRDSSFLSAFVDVIVCIFMCTMTLTAALFVTLGFKIWCEEMTRRFENCQDAVGNPIDKADGIDSSDFFNQMFTAQFGIWMSFTVWFTLLVFSVVKLCRYHHEENLRVSMAKERKRLINEDMVSEIPPMHHTVPSVTASVHNRRLGGRFHVRGRTGNDNSGILTCADDNNEIQAENIRQENNGRDKESAYAQQTEPTFDPRAAGNSNSKVVDEGALQNQGQHQLDPENFEGEDRFNTSSNVSNVHDQYSYQSHDNNSHTNSYTGTLNSAHSQQHSPHASACSASVGGATGSGSNNTMTGGYVTPTPQQTQQPQSDYESSYHSSSMNSSQHSAGQAQNPFPHGNQIIVQDPIKPDLLN